MATKDSNNPNRRLYTTGSRGEFQFGFSRAIRHGSVVRVAGTAGIGEDGSVVSDDVVDQMRSAIGTVKASLADLGCTLDDVVMTRVYVRNAADIQNVAVVHGDLLPDAGRERSAAPRRRVCWLGRRRFQRRLFRPSVL